MKKLTWLLRIIGSLQLLLGLLYMFVPERLLSFMGHSTPPADLDYPLAMLAARFIGYGLAFWVISHRPAQYRLWINNMILIQGIDLAAGLFYTLTGTVKLSLSGFPMFNAVWILGLLLLWRPRSTEVCA